MRNQLTPPASADDLLDRPMYMHQARILRALHAAVPIDYEGQNHFIHTITAQQAGGRIEMTVYLTGDATPIDSTKIELAAAATGQQ